MASEAQKEGEAHKVATWVNLNISLRYSSTVEANLKKRRKRKEAAEASGSLRIEEVVVEVDVVVGEEVTWVLWPFAITMHTHIAASAPRPPTSILLGKLLKAPFSCSFFFDSIVRSQNYLTLLYRRGVARNLKLVISCLGNLKSPHFFWRYCLDNSQIERASVWMIQTLTTSLLFSTLKPRSSLQSTAHHRVFYPGNLIKQIGAVF